MGCCPRFARGVVRRDASAPAVRVVLALAVPLGRAADAPGAASTHMLTVPHDQRPGRAYAWPTAPRHRIGLWCATWPAPGRRGSLSMPSPRTVALVLVAAGGAPLRR